MEGVCMLTHPSGAPKAVQADACCTRIGVEDEYFGVEKDSGARFYSFVSLDQREIVLLRNALRKRYPPNALAALICMVDNNNCKQRREALVPLCKVQLRKEIELHAAWSGQCCVDDGCVRE